MRPPETGRGEQAGALARMALALTAWTERWIPDAFIFALLATFIVVIAAVSATSATLPVWSKYHKSVILLCLR